MVRRAIGLAIAAMAGISGAVAVAAPASADGHCTTLFACVWQNTSRGGGERDIYTTLSNFSGQTFDNGAGLDNAASSVENADPDHSFELCANSNYGGFCLLVLPNQYFSSLSPYGFDNQASSGRYV